MPERETVALVLAGGGARGAYEAGVLSALLPELERRDERPRLVIGTSVGALNTAFLGATAHLPAAAVVAEAERIWREIRYGEVLSGLGSLRGLRRSLAYLAEVAGLPVKAASILDPAPLEATVERLVPFEQLAANVGDGLVQAAVVTTSASTSRSVVFHTQLPSPERDDKRGIDYFQAELASEHVRGSAAIPVLFPAVRIETPARARDWYFDGGTRLNTPIKPAISLGAQRVVVIGLNSIAGKAPRPPESESAPLGSQPDLAEGASQLLQAVLVDPLINDVATLASRNRLLEEVRRAGARQPERVEETRRPGVELPGRESIPYIFVAPTEVDVIGEIAAAVFNKHYRSARALLRSPDMSVLGRLVAGGEDPVHGELLSYLFFAPEFTRELLELGRRDGERWLAEEHEDGPWRIVLPLPS